MNRMIEPHNVPSFVYGTAWKEDQTKRLTLQALDAGFRAIDTANQRKHYHEAGVGEALAQVFSSGLVTREELFLQTKFTSVDGQDHRLPYDAAADPATQVAQSFASSLMHLGVATIDSYVLHGPTARRGLSPYDWAVWGAMEALQRAGKTRFLGISNVSIDQLELLLSRAEVRPTFVQNRCYAKSGWDRQVRALCQKHEIVYQGFSLLTANRTELARDEVAQIAARHKKTVAQVVFAFALRVGMQPLTGSKSAQHLNEDLQSCDVELSESEVELLSRLDQSST